MAYDEGLAERIRQVTVEFPTLTEKKMFGGLAFMIHDYMFVGVQGDQLMARVGPENYAEALHLAHVREMDFTGRPMKGYIFVEPAGIESDEELKHWVYLCAEFVQSLPPKKQKKKK